MSLKNNGGDGKYRRWMQIQNMGTNKNSKKKIIKI